MIDPDKCKAVFQLHQQGVSLREISRLLLISRNSVRRIIKQQGAPPQTERSDKIRLDVELLRTLYQQCDGWIQRVHEKLLEEEQIQVSYSTLTRILRQEGISKPAQTRCERVPDEPGAEMQHDTTVYRVKLAGSPVKVIASLLYLRYSKRRYLKFYRVFHRFAMKCFLHEALMYWGYAARVCVIDNTNLARLRGAGKRAVIVPEMEVFARRYGYEFLCHEIGHANRKAGEERSFWTVETNFLPGRSFDNLEDLNRQGFEWATHRMHHRPQSKTKLIPAKAFEYEQHFLKELWPHLPPPFLSHSRRIDQYGYVAFDGNYYWVPGEGRHEVKLLQYAEHLKIFAQRRLLAEYPLATEGVKNERISPPGQPAPRRQPRHRKGDSQQEEKQLRNLSAEVSAYVDYVLQTPGIQRHRLLREWLRLSRRVPREVFVQTLARALRYRVSHLPTLHNIAWFCMSQAEGGGKASAANLEPEVDESFRQRPAYQEGFLTDEPDLSVYDSPEADSSEANSSEANSSEANSSEANSTDANSTETDALETDDSSKSDPLSNPQPNPEEERGPDHG